MPSDFWWKNYKFCSIDAYFLILFFKRSKVICQRGKPFFFHQKSEGIAFTFCRYLNQNMRAFKFCRYCLQKYFLIPSNFDEKKYHCILRAIPWEFWDEVFSLKIWGHFIQQCSSNDNSNDWLLSFELPVRCTPKKIRAKATFLF